MRAFCEPEPLIIFRNVKKNDSDFTRLQPLFGDKKSPVREFGICIAPFRGKPSERTENLEVVDSIQTTERPLATPVPMKNSSALDLYFAETSALGSYAVIQVWLGEEPIQIVVDRHMGWLQDSLEKFFGVRVAKLNLKQISEYLGWLRKNPPLQFSLATVLGLAPHKNIENSKLVKVFFLDDIAHSKSQRSLIFSLVAQILLEKYTSRETRVVCIEEKHDHKNHVGYAVLIKSNIEGYQVLDAALEFKNIGHQTFYNLHEKSSHQGLSVVWVLKTDAFCVLQSRSLYDEKTKSFTIFSGEGRELKFSFLGRTPTEKKFSREEQQIRLAAPDEFVPIEICFHPFWRRLGHTTLRMGEALYELSSKGWKSHLGKQARAYLFNNPYFKEQYKLYSAAGMSPTSIGVTLMVKKSQVERLQVILQNLVSAQGKEREKFNLYLNNCNQGIMRVLTEAGISGFTDKGYHGFSAVLSFRKILVEPHLEQVGLTLYPLPGTEINEALIRRWIPRLLYRHNSTMMEVSRALPSLYWDAVVFWCKRVSDVIFKFTKLRLWKGRDGYQYLNT